MGKRILVVTGGENTAAPRATPVSTPPYDLVIAADSGLDVAHALGLQPDIVVGDLDSASLRALDRARANGSEIEAHPAEKDHTDFELALNRAMAEEASEICVIGGAGGRPDHWLANLALLGVPARAGVMVSAEMGGWSISVVVPDHPYCGQHNSGELLSLLPIAGDVQGITTDGLVYPLRGEDLPAGTSRGVSNLTSGGSVRVQVDGGTLLMLRPQEQVQTSERDEDS